MGWPFGGGFGPEVGPPPPEQESSAGAGLQTVQYEVGPGWYFIYNTSIQSDEAYLQSCKIYMEYEHADATTSNLYLGGGFVSLKNPFVLLNVMVEGPGKITGEAYMLDAANTFKFVCNYRKVLP